jgi:hypothetical protein
LNHDSPPAADPGTQLDPLFVFDFTAIDGPGEGQRFSTYWYV